MKEEKRETKVNNHLGKASRPREGSGAKSVPLTVAKVRRLLRKAERAGTHEEFLDTLIQLGEKLLREFFNDAIDLYMDKGPWAGDRKRRLERLRREIADGGEMEEKSGETLLKALFLASRDKWLESRGLKGREKPDALDKEALIQLKPGDRKVRLIENYLDGERKLLEVLGVMVRHEKYFGESWDNLTIDQLKKLLELHDVTLFLPETINKLIAVVNSTSPEDKDKLVELVLSTYEYVSKYLLGGISALYLTLGRLDLAGEVRKGREDMIDGTAERRSQADTEIRVLSEGGSAQGDARESDPQRPPDRRPSGPSGESMSYC